MIEILIARVFNTRNLAHLAHWRTKSFSEHMALGDFYDAIVGQLEEIVECYQGSNGLIKIPELPAALFQKDMVKYLEEELGWILENMKEMSKDDSVENLIQTLAASYQRTIYKLKNLS